MGGAAHILAIFTMLFVAPLVLGSWILAQHARRSVLMGWFSVAIGCFLLIILIGLIYLATTPV
jgi:hypothetical protein